MWQESRMAERTKNIAYLEQRLARTLSLEAAATDECAKASHAALARLYRLELVELKTGTHLVVAENSPLDHARQGGLLLVGGEPA